MLPGGEVVADHLVRAGHDRLRAAFVDDDVRRGPGGGLVALLAPLLFARRGVEREDVVGAFVIPDDDHRVAVQRGRVAFAEAVARLHLPELFFPEQLAREVERVEAARSEVGVDALAVGQRRAGRERAVLVRPFVRQAFVHGLLPLHLAVGA